jgi:hypothetical protein
MFIFLLFLMATCLPAGALGIPLGQAGPPKRIHSGGESLPSGGKFDKK